MLLNRNHAKILSIAALMILWATVSFTAKTEGIVKKEDFKIAGVSIGDNRETVKKAFGRELSFSCFDSPTFCDQECEAKYKGVCAYYCDGRLVNLSCKSKKYRTPTGLRVGMTKEEVFQLQGKTTSVLANGEEIFSYELLKRDCQLIIHLKRSLVAEIELWDDFT
jgi:hypothetical protein